MRPFRHVAPTSLREASALLNEPGSEALAGGTDLLSLLKDDVERVDRLVSLRGVAGLSGVELEGETLRIGAMTTLQELRDHADAMAAVPALAVAVDGVASAQLRAMGTVGGDLLQRPRCWYYRRGFGLLALDASGRSLVEAGDNRYHAIFPEGEARFVNPSSLAPLLVALGAEAVVAGPSGERRLPVESLWRAPRAADERENTLAPGELLVGVAARVADVRLGLHEVRQRRSLDWPLMAAAAALFGSGARPRSARVVLGHAAPRPWHVPAAGEALANQAPVPEAAVEAAEAAVAAARPMSRNRYKVQLARVAVRRAILQAARMEV